MIFLFRLRWCLYETRYIGQAIYRLTDKTFSMHLYREEKLQLVLAGSLCECSIFFANSRIYKTMNYIKNVLLKGLILNTATY